MGKELTIEHREITPEWFLAHYAELLPRYISNGKPTEDTMSSYCYHIGKFLEGCEARGWAPLRVTDFEVREYFWKMSQHAQAATVSAHITAVRTFFKMARRIGLIQANPCAYIHASSGYRFDDEFHYFTTEQIGEVLEFAQEEPDPFIRKRNTAMLYLMGIEGLRVVELHRMNDRDIDWKHGSIYIRGKGHAGRIYPAPETFEVLRSYLYERPVRECSEDDAFFYSDRRHNYARISRNGVRYAIDKILRRCSYKQHGVSCHIFRHSCGTNLYAATKDLRLVQETLRQRDPKVTSRYAHVQERMTNRYTARIIPGKPKKN